MIKVDECFIHCGAAFRRGEVWDTTTWPAREEQPSPGQMLVDHAKLEGVTGEQVEAGLQEYYDTAIWIAGGGDDE